ncbi:MAG: hypothetical protein A2X96_12455 [Syntrophobacterales bacterium GWC2_56_13]|nr:MAG: hypothetical protein A2X96_12455 [Syntrophobacterales bacterium GWC2_56_13]HAL56329.1 hypothetical protein [Bacteroidota bacterium]
MGIIGNGHRIFMKKTLAWLKSIVHWLVEWRLFCFAFLVVAAPAGFIVFVDASETVIRITGMLLQLLGIGTVAWGIHITRKEFGHPSVFAVWRKRLSRFPPFCGRLVTGSAHITLSGGGTVSARGYGSLSAGPNPTIEARVQALEENLKLVNDRVSQTQNEMDREFRKQSDTLKQEQQVRADEDQHIRAKMEATETGGLHISAMGALCLFVGVIMSSVASELAMWLK